jgi:hypothetical protein
MQGQLIELEHFRVLLKYLGTWPVSIPVLVHGIRAAQVFRQRFSGSLSQSVSVKASPFFSSSCHGSRCCPVLLLACLFLAVSKGTGLNQLLR